ncbi:hypothetical protein [Prosthecodimorpha hirschii]|uniref:hypothetical protein n=1 Tax=Prosthecodimorpha hirschii TaxID=665126 RepID=UPI00112D6899|nr:hypothetical protein [Prosthecomicrobium hirschii]
MITLERILSMVEQIGQTTTAITVAKNLVTENELKLIPPPAQTFDAPEALPPETADPYRARPAVSPALTLAGLSSPTATSPAANADTGPEALAPWAGVDAAEAGDAPAPAPFTAVPGQTATGPISASLLATSLAARALRPDDGMVSDTGEAARTADTARALTTRELIDRALEETLNLIEGDRETLADRTTAAAAAAQNRRLGGTEGSASAVRAAAASTDADGATTQGTERSARASSSTEGRTSGLAAAGLPLADPATLSAAAADGRAGTIIDSMILNAAMIPGWPRPRPLTGALPEEEAMRARKAAAGQAADGAEEPSLVGEALLLSYLAALGVGEAMMARIRTLLVDENRRRNFLLFLARILKALKSIMASLKEELKRMREEQEAPPEPDPGTDMLPRGRRHRLQL